MWNGNKLGSTDALEASGICGSVDSKRNKIPKPLVFERKKITVFRAGPRGRGVLSYRKKPLKFKKRYFKKLALNFQWDRAALIWNSLGCWGVLRENPWIQLTFHVQYLWLLGMSLCPFYHKRAGLGRLWLESGNVQWFLGRDFWAEHCCPPLTKSTTWEFPWSGTGAGTSRDTKESDPNGEITQNGQFREKPHC